MTPILKEDLTTLDIEIPEEENIANSEEVFPKINEVTKILPKYFIDYNLSKQDFLLPILKKHRGMSCAKHILTYAKFKKSTSEQIKTLEKQLSELGQIWAKVKFSKIKKRISLCYSPLAFALLGNFNCDSYSCFGQGDRQNPDKRFAIGVHPTLFLCLFHKNGVDDIKLEDRTDTIDGRMIACFTENNTVLNFSNCYGYAVRPNIQHFCKHIFKNLTNSSKTKVTPDVFSFRGGLPYTDLYINSVSEKEIDRQSCDVTTKFYNERFRT